jgi:hypothetical protein
MNRKRSVYDRIGMSRGLVASLQAAFRAHTNHSRSCLNLAALQSIFSISNYYLGAWRCFDRFDPIELDLVL